jgi:hypothetical protein
LIKKARVLPLKSLSDSKILLPELLLGVGCAAGGKEGSNGRNGTHLDQLDDIQVRADAEK